MAGKRYIRIDVDLLVDLYRSGKTTRQIAEEIGASYATVGRRLNAAGVEMRVQGPEHIVELRDKSWLSDMYVTKGLSSEVIARQIGASPRTVVAWLEAHGIDRRPRNQHAGR